PRTRRGCWNRSRTTAMAIAWPRWTPPRCAPCASRYTNCNRKAAFPPRVRYKTVSTPSSKDRARSKSATASFHLNAATFSSRPCGIGTNYARPGPHACSMSRTNPCTPCAASSAKKPAEPIPNAHLALSTQGRRRHPMKILFRSLLAGLALAATSALAAWPDQPIRVVVPFPPGGGTDIVARSVLEGVSRQLGQPIIIENKAGAGTQIGTVAVANAEADGYTLLFTSSAFSVTPSLRDNANYDPIASFQPIGMAALHPFVLVAHPSLPANTVAELIAYAKQHPG